MKRSIIWCTSARTHAVILMLLTLLLCLVLSGPGCKTNDLETSVYKGLRMSAATYDAAMKSAAELHDQGRISDDDMLEVMAVADEYRTAYLSAVSLLEAYHTTGGTAQGEQALQQAIVAYSLAMAELVSLVKTYRMQEDAIHE